MNSFNIYFKNNWKLYIYYLILHLFCMSWTNLELVAPPGMMRLLITGAVFLPLIKFFWLTPAVVILFIGMRFNSVAPFGYIPQSWDIYFYIIIIVGFLNNLIYRSNLFNFTKKQFIVILLIFLVDMVNLKIGTEFLFFAILLFLCYNILKTEISINLTVLSFVLFSISMSVYYIIFAKEFAVSYAALDGIERSFWVDPNYLGIYLGIGVFFSVYYLVNFKKKHLCLFYKILFVFCAILTSIVILLQASRGSLLFLFLSLAVVIFRSSISIKYKILIITLILSLNILFFQQGFFELLLNRIGEDDGSGSGRIDIWFQKLDYLLKHPIYFVGAGYLGSVKMFPPFNLDCHNEYVSTLMNYGLWGILFMFIEFVRLFFCVNENRVIVLALLLYCAGSFMTLSPFSCPTGWLGVPLVLPLLYRFADNNMKKI